MPDNLAEAIEWLQGILATIPEEHRDSAKIEIDSTGGYEGSHYATIEIEYSRPPTEADIAERKEAARKRAEQELAWAQQRLASAQRDLDAAQPR
jgi:hypothetical protein